MVVIPVLIFAAIIYSLSLVHLIEGLAANDTAFGLPAGNTAFQYLLGAFFGLIAFLIVFAPFFMTARDKKLARKKSRR